MQPPAGNDGFRKPGLFWAGLSALGVVGAGFCGLVLYFAISKRAAPNSASAITSNIASTETKPADEVTPEPKDFSMTNSISVLLGQESADDGIRHLWKQADGRTTVESVDGVPCRYLNRTNKSFGYLYFAIADTFKRD